MLWAQRMEADVASSDDEDGRLQIQRIIKEYERRASQGYGANGMEVLFSFIAIQKWNLENGWIGEVTENLFE